LKVTEAQAASADSALAVAFAQLALSLLGLGGVGFTVYFAALAWQEAKRSANAAHLTLEDARADAAAQAERFQKDLRIAEDNLKLARRSIAETDPAWLSVEVTPITGLKVDAEWVSIEVRVLVRNVGKGPAIGIQSTGELTFDIAKLDQAIRRNPGLRSLAGRFGKVIFPGGEDSWEGRQTVKRRALIEAIAEDRSREERLGVYPSIVTGVRYSLPGDSAPHMTYAYLHLANKLGGPLRLDGKEVSFDLADLTWAPDELTGPVT
jgi:hypothetical protein